MLDGTTFIVSLRADGLHVHQLHSRVRRPILTLSQLVALTERQPDLFAVGAGSSCLPGSNDPGRAGARGNPTMNASPSPRIGFHRCAPVTSARPSLPEGWALKIPVDGVAGPVVKQGHAHGRFTRLEPSVFTGGAESTSPGYHNKWPGLFFLSRVCVPIATRRGPIRSGTDSNQGQPIQVRWNGRTTWHTRQRARTQAKQFLRGWLGGWLR